MFSRFHNLTFLTLIMLFGSLSALSQTSEKSFVDDELLVKFKPGVERENKTAFNSSLGAELQEEFGDLGWQRVKLPVGKSVSKALAEYLSDPRIEAAQPNYYYRLHVTPNDPQFGSLYGMTRISAPAAWDITTGNPNVVVANIDTGSRYTHQDLAANMWTNTSEIPANNVDDDGNGFVDDIYGYDFRFNDANPLDEHGHGTHTSGTIGAAGNNMLGVTGVNWTVKIMTVKIYSATGTDTTAAMLINAYNYVRLMKNRGVNIRVTNNSYGGCNEACGYDQATKDALDALGDSGVLNVFSAGNDNRNTDTAPSYPGSYSSPGVLTVASSTSTDARSGFSNFGISTVDLAAPGSGILSTTFGSDSTYGNSTGTSMAAPHVTGAVALLAGLNPSLSAASLKATIMNTVDPLAAWSGLVKTGGRLNAQRALQNQTTCNFNLSANSIAAPTKGGMFTVNVTAPQNCDYTAKSDKVWVSVLAGSPGSGSGAISFRVGVNSSISRSGTLNIGGQTVTVTQARN
jgi:subtilisin family serine protease